jgi:hypothetical protein
VTQCDSAPPWRIAQASVAGTAHAASATPCQDAGYAAVLPCGTLLAAVADGAGSASHAGQGAQAAVAAFAAACTEAAAADPALGFFDRAFALDWLQRLRAALAALAAARGRVAADYACTFLGALIGAESACFVQIGDGAIVVAEAGDAPRCVFWPQHGEFANSTFFVTHGDAAELLQVRHEPRHLDRAALFSDGLERLVLDFSARCVYPPSLSPIFAWLAGLEDGADACGPLALYLDSPRVNLRTDDDKTLILATRARP